MGRRCAVKHTPQVRYFSSYSDDFVESADQKYCLPYDYEWIRRDRRSRFLSGLIYGLALIFSTVYCRLFLHVRIKGAKKLRQHKGGGFIYANHTLPVGDVFDPALACFPKRIYTVASPANLGIPVIGKILPYLGALPLDESLHGMKQLTKTVEERTAQGCFVVIYPEAHVWEYCADIRPFSETAFKFPAKLEKPVFVLTTTFQKRWFGKRPKVTIYADGPFLPQKDGTMKQQAETLCRQVRECMEQRAQASTYRFIEYRHSSENQTMRTDENTG